MIRIGIVGCGRILAAHLRGYRLLREAGYDQFRIAGVCSRRRRHAEAAVRRGAGEQRAPVGLGPGDPLSVGDEHIADFQDDVECRVFDDWDEMIASGDVDAVNDFTTHELHHQVAESTLAAGKHLLTQKPLAVSVAAARRMCQLAERHGCTFSVFENARFRDDTRQLRWLLDGGLIGPLQMVTLTNIGNWWAPDRVVAETPWRHLRDAGGGLTLDIGVHLFNHLRHVAGEIESVWGQVSIQEPTRVVDGQRIICDADDTVICGFRTRDGVEGSLHISWSGHGQPLLSGTGRGLCYFARQGSVIGGEVQWDGGSRAPLSQLYREQASGEVQERDFPLGLTDGFALNQLDWMEAIRQGRQGETSGREGLRDLAAAFAVLESHGRGARVDVDDVESGEVRQWQREIDRRYGIQ